MIIKSMAMIQSKWVQDRRKHHISTTQNVLALSTCQTLSILCHSRLKITKRLFVCLFWPMLDSAHLTAKHKPPPNILQGKTGFISFLTSITIRITEGFPEKNQKVVRQLGMGGGCWGEGYRVEERICPLYSMSLCICVSLILNQLLT